MTTLAFSTRKLAITLQQHNWMLATAESCTGGLIAAACTNLAGSSAWFERGFVCYSNLAKIQQLGVPETLIAQHGAVSEAVAHAMAQGAMAHSAAQVAIAITGIAGPTGGSPEKPVGTVWIGWSIKNQVHTNCLHLAGDRQHIRAAACAYALERLVLLIHTL